MRFVLILCLTLLPLLGHVSTLPRKADSVSDQFVDNNGAIQIGVPEYGIASKVSYSYLGDKLMEVLREMKASIEAKIASASPEMKAALIKIRDTVDDLIQKAGVAIGGGFLIGILKMLQLVDQLKGALEKLSERLSYGILVEMDSIIAQAERI